MGRGKFDVPQLTCNLSRDGEVVDGGALSSGDGPSIFDYLAAEAFFLSANWIIPGSGLNPFTFVPAGSETKLGVLAGRVQDTRLEMSFSSAETAWTISRSLAMPCGPIHPRLTAS